MINVLSVKQIKEAEAAAMAGGTTEDELIERAASRIYKHIENNIEKTHKIAVLAGRGNNGADGLSFALLAVKGGYHVTVYLMPGKRNDYVTQRLALLEHNGCKCIEVELLSDIDYRADIFIDAVLGTGCNRPIEGILADVIRHINNLHKTVVSVDMPTGLNADTGAVEGIALSAAQTITFGSFKLGQIIGEGRNYCGRLSLFSIGLSAGAYSAQIVDDERVKMPKRLTVSNKSTYGRVKIIAGSPAMPGGALLAHESALASLRSGAGYSTLCVPGSLAAAYQSRALEETLYMMPDKDGYIVYDEKVLDEIVKTASTVVIGMGLGENPEIIRIIRYLSRKDITLVIDADGLNALASDLSAVKDHKCRLILTPHVGEFRRLAGEKSDCGAEAVKMMAAGLDAVIAMKSATTVISDGKEVYLNITGSPAMAKAGSGDVLSGMIGAFAANFEPLDAIIRACYYFGKAGERSAKEKGEWSVLAGDIILKL